VRVRPTFVGKFAAKVQWPTYFSSVGVAGCTFAVHVVGGKKFAVNWKYPTELRERAVRLYLGV
jgi:hypothetical protein